MPAGVLGRLAPSFPDSARRPPAVRSALAAMAAWVLVAPWGGVADEYPYYAPLPSSS